MNTGFSAEQLQTFIAVLHATAGNEQGQAHK